jgi:cbb3-type cytochrome oxidase cytochrome c subunit
MRRIVIAAVAAVALGAGPVLADEAAPAKEAKGKELFLKYSCNSCHTVAAQAIAKKAAAAEDEEAGAAKATAPAADKAKEAPAKAVEPAAAPAAKKRPPDLSGVGVDQKADWIVKYLQKLETLHEKKHMKKFKGTDSELTELAAWLEAQKDAEAAKKANEATAPAKEEAKEAAKEAPKTE